MNETFRRFAAVASELMGAPWAFVAAGAVIVVWLLSGPVFGFSNTWQLMINTATTVVTFLMVFLIQNTQNRDMKAMHLKLDEVIRGVGGARTGLVSLEDLSDEQLKDLKRQFGAMADERAVSEQAVEAAEEQTQEGGPEAKP